MIMAGNDTWYSNSTKPRPKYIKYIPKKITTANEDQLQKLKKIYNESDKDEDGGLSMEQFKMIMKRTEQRELSDWELEHAFLLMDGNCDGSIDCDEYLTFSMLGSEGLRQFMQALREKPFPNDVKPIDTSYLEPIVRIVFYPHVSKHSNLIDFTDGKYVTMARDGHVTFWSLDMKPSHFFNVKPSIPRDAKPWYVDMTCLFNNHLAFASTDRELVFYDTSNQNPTRRYYITGLDDCVTCLDCQIENQANREMLITVVWGDTSGSLFSLRIHLSRGSALFGGRSQKKSSIMLICIQDIFKGAIPDCTILRIPKAHLDWVLMVKCISSNKGTFMSCSHDSQSSLFFGSFKKKNDPYIFKVSKGLLCFDYCHDLNLIVTGGMDYIIRIWNPYVTKRPTIYLKGHKRPVIHVTLGEKNLLYSVDKGNCVRIFDFKKQTCIQHVAHRVIRLGSLSISAVFFNRITKNMLLATYIIALLEHNLDDEKETEVVSHTRSVVAALYTSVFNVIVSACERSIVSVWHLDNGKKLMQWVNAHSFIRNGIEIPVEITTMSFDIEDRRCITGARDGTVKIWNVNNAICLQKFQVPEKTPVVAIAASKRFIYVTGWNRSINIFKDNGGNGSLITVRPPAHRDDILAICLLGANHVVTTSYDGSIVVTDVDTGSQYRKYSSTRDRMLNHGGQCYFNTGGVRPISGKSGMSSACNTTPSSGWEMNLLPTESGTVNTYESSVECVVCLPTRNVLDRETAVFMTGNAEGIIRSYSVHKEGGLLGRFDAGHNDSDGISAFCTDKRNWYLFMATSQGYIKTWDIRDYLKKNRLTDEERDEHKEDMKRKFVYYKTECLINSHRPSVDYTNLDCPKCDRCFMPPRLLNSYRAHLCRISTLTYVEDRSLVISASIDCTVRLWTLGGRYLGTFGEAWSPLSAQIDAKKVRKKAPKELRRQGSAKTLRVLNGGRTPRWDALKSLVQWVGLTTLSMPIKIPDEVEMDTGVPDEPISSILGKSYKKIACHQRMPILEKPVLTSSTISVYHTLPLIPVDFKDVGYSPSIVEEIHQRRLQRGAQKSKHRGAEKCPVSQKSVGKFPPNREDPAVRTRRFLKKIPRYRDAMKAEEEENKSGATSGKENSLKFATGQLPLFKSDWRKGEPRPESGVPLPVTVVPITETDVPLTETMAQLPNTSAQITERFEPFPDRIVPITETMVPLLDTTVPLTDIITPVIN